MINEAAIQMSIIRDALTQIESVRTTFLQHNPSTVGTVLQGNTAALSASINAIRAQVDLAVWNTLIGGYVPTHEGKALDG